MWNMYYVEKTFSISASHKLNLNYKSKCKETHGHNWRIKVYCKSEMLNQNDMVIDFAEIKHLIADKIDHKDLNKQLDFNPTAENLACWIVGNVPYCYKAKVQESEGSIAIYERDCK